MRLKSARTGLAVLLSALALAMPTLAMADDVYLAIGFSPSTAKFAIALDRQRRPRPKARRR
jgi:hypothetical protein